MSQADLAGPPRPKATLFCPTCGHESRVDGDWELRTVGGRETTVCPECGARLDDRPAGGDADGADDAGIGTMAARLVRAALAPVYLSLAVQFRLLDPRSGDASP